MTTVRTKYSSWLVLAPVIVWLSWSSLSEAFSTSHFRRHDSFSASVHGSSAVCHCREDCEDVLSRRSAVVRGVFSILSTVVGTSTASFPSKALSEESILASNNVPEPTNKALRARLLDLIASGKVDDEQVVQTIEQLVLVDPSKGRGATLSSDLEGEWKLLWSIKADAFSPLLQLPNPFKPESYQYLGQAAATEVGVDRVAQGLTGGLLLGNNQLWLSSGVLPSETDPSILEIYPPFRFQLGGRYGSNQVKRTLVEAGSDAEFRKVNGRTVEAQAAPKNLYKQLYLEQDGPGSLRISTITGGDPVIVGAIFVHQKV